MAMVEDILRPSGIVVALGRVTVIPQSLSLSRAELAGSGVGGDDSSESSLISTTSTFTFLEFGEGGRLAGSALSTGGTASIGPPDQDCLGAP